MRNSILFVFCLFCCMARGQKVEMKILDSATVMLSVHLDFQRDIVSPAGPSNPEQHIIQNLGIRLKAGDIIIEYELRQSRKKGGDYSVEIQEIITASGALFPIKPEFIYGDIGKPITMLNGSRKRIILANTPQNDNIKWLSGEVTFKLRIERSAIIVGKWEMSCSFPPYLKYKDFIPESIFGGIGLGTLIVGLVMDEDSDKLYEQYKKQDKKTDADPIFDDANKKHQEAFVTKAVGIGILTGAIISTLLKGNNHRIRNKYFNQYCEGISVQPFYDNQTTFAAPSGQAGITFTYTFK